MNYKYINDKDNNLSGSFPSKNPKDIKKKSGILMAVLPLAACGGGSSGGGGAVTVAPPTPDYVESPTNVFVASFNANPKLNKASSTADITVTGNNANDTITTGSGNDTIDAKDGTNIIKSGSGTDTIKAGSGADKIRSGEGIDNVSSGGGNDVIVVVGTTTATQYTNASITNSAGSGTDLSGLITLADLNGRTVSEIGAGETINGGTGSNTLFIYGTVDLTGVILTNVTTLYVNSDVTLTPAQIAGFTTIDGDGNSVINIMVPGGSSDTYILDLSTMTTSDLANINIAGDVTVKISDASDLTGITAITSSNTSTVTLSVIDGGTATAISLSDIKGIFTAVDKIIMEDQVSLILEAASDVTSLGLTEISGDGTIGSTSVQAAIDVVKVASSINFSPTGSVTISGTATEDQVLTAANTLADADGLGSITYQWTRDGVDISSAINSTYTLVQADVDAVITVVASYSDGKGTATTVTSSATSAVANVSHAATGSVSISGTVNIGSVLTASNDLADADGLGTITYQWKRAGIDIGNATSSTYTLIQADVGNAITVVASYTDGESTSETVASIATSNVNGTPTDITLSATNVSHLAEGNENATDGYKIGYLTWFDPNPSDTGIYTLDDSRFEIFVEDGVGWLKLKSGETLNMNTDASVTVSVTITDAGGLSYSESFNISTIETNTPYSIANVDVVSLTGDNSIDSTLMGYKFRPDTADGPTTITYSFPTSSSYWSENAVTGYKGTNNYPDDGFVELTSAVKSSFTLILGSASNVANVFFNLVDDIQTSAGQIRVGWTDGFSTNAIAWVGGFPEEGQKGSDIWLHNGALTESFSSEGDGFFNFVLLHELGHALGLKHSQHPQNGFPAGTEGNNQQSSSVMSYYSWPGTKAWNVLTPDLFPSTFMKNDILALQHLYDTNSINNNFDTSYSFNTSERYYKTVWDTGGNDTFTISGTEGVVIDLRPGKWSNVGTIIEYKESGVVKHTRTDTVYLPEAVTIENASGGSGNDRLTGNTDSNILTGNAGNDVLEGGSGTDNLEGGTGADNLYGEGDLDTFILEAGDSVLSFGGAGNAGTVSGYDTIHDFKTGNGTSNSETINTVATATVVADTAGTDGTDSTLTIGGTAIKSHAITNGVISFDDADTFAGMLDISTNSEVAAVLDYIQNQDLGNAGATNGFDVGYDTFLFTQGNDAGDDAQDVVVRLVDVQIDSLITTNGTGEFDLYIV